MKNIFLILGLSAFFFGCKKQDIRPHNSSEASIGFSQKNIPSGTKVAERVNDIVTCTIDEDILRAAIANYYGGGATVTKRMIMKEFRPNSPNPFYGTRGRVKNGQIVTRFFFELVPVTQPDGTIDLYLPEIGHEQHVTGYAGNVCRLKLFSTSMGQSFGSACYSIYSTSKSEQSTDCDGTNGLILQLLPLI